MRRTPEDDLERLGLSLAPSKQIGVDDIVRLARLAEELGYASVWVPETWGTDAVSVLAVLSQHTRRIGLASGVLNVFSRSPALIAQTASTLQTLSAGRFLLGLGTSGPIVVEDWHGTPYRSPVERTRDYVRIIRLALRGETVNFESERFKLRNFRLLNPPVFPVPIYIAALGERNVTLAGEVADGWLPIFAPRGTLERLMSQLRAGAEVSGRSLEAFERAAYLPALLGERSQRLLRQQIAYYVGAMGTYYSGLLSRSGFSDAAADIRSRWQAGDRPGSIAAVPQDLLDCCTLGSDIEVARSRIAEYRDEGITLPILAIPNGATSDEVAHTLRGLAPGAGPPASADA